MYEELTMQAQTAARELIAAAKLSAGDLARVLILILPKLFGKALHH